MPKILVVDDMALCREPIAEALRRNGYQAICATDGSEALSLLREQRPDLILLDLTMPEMDGLAVLRVVRRNPHFKEIPVILLTDMAQRRYVLDAVQCGVQGYILKSEFSLEELLARVEKCLGESTLASVSPRTEERETHAQPPEPAIPKTITPAIAPAAAKPSHSEGVVLSSRNCKPSDSDGKLTSVNSINDLSPVITKDDLVKLVKEGLELRPLSPTVHNLMAITVSSHCSINDVAKAVVNDQAMCIRLIKFANSSVYSRGAHIANIKMAVSRMGIRAVRKLVMTLGVLDRSEEINSKHVDVRLFWEHSIACGLIANAIAKARQCKEADDYFVWGVVHDVGRLILLDNVPDKYSGVWDAAEALALPLELVEPKLMLLDHCDILKKALEEWKFPREFIAPVINHHQSVLKIKRLVPGHAEAAATIALANQIAHALLLGSSGNEVIYPLDDFVDTLGLQASTIAQITEAAPDETNDLKFTMLARAGAEPWPNFPAKVKARLSTAIRPLCVSREPLIDAYRIFCVRISEPSEVDPPNLGVIYLRDAREQPTLIAEYEAQEQNADGGPLPVVLICDKGAINADHGFLKARPHVVLKTPVRISCFLTAIQDLMRLTPRRPETSSVNDSHT